MDSLTEFMSLRCCIYPAYQLDSIQAQSMTATHPNQALRNVISVPVFVLVPSIIMVGVVVSGPA